MKLKLPKTVSQALNIPDKGDYTACVKKDMFQGRYDVTAGFRLRIPSAYKNLFHIESHDERQVRITLWAENGMPHFSYKDHEEPLYTPSGRHPRYDRGECFCSVCQQTFRNKDKCSYCNRVLRKNPRKKKDKQHSKPQ
ncbi:MAG: hypothetical protein QXI97_02460 [Nitrososphaerota archaeon]